MNFLDPFAAAFAASIPVVITFYLLKRRRVVRLVPSTLLWQKFLAESQASAPFQKLRHNWLLILQILLLLLIVLALTRPYFSSTITGGSLQVVIMDASASMQSTDVKPSRFEDGLKRTENLIEGLGRGDRMILIQSSAITEVIQSPTSDKNQLKLALKKFHPTESPTRLNEALELAQTLTRDQSDSVIHLISDGGVSELDLLETSGMNLVFHKVGDSGSNVAITALDIRTHPEDPRLRAIFLNISNFDSKPVNGMVELLFEGDVVDTRVVEAQAGQTVPLVFTAAQNQDGLFTVRLAAEDNLAVDNSASMISMLPRPASVLLLTQGNRFLERALQSAPQINLKVTTDPNTDFNEADIAVIDGLRPSIWPDVNVIVINQFDPLWFGPVSEVEAPAIVDWRSTHPLLRFVSLDNVRLAKSQVTKTPSWAQSLAESPQAALMLAGERGSQKIVWIGFDLLESTWPLQLSFPIFVANAVDWLNPSTAQANLLNVKTSQPFRWPLTSTNNTASMKHPDGSIDQLDLESGSSELIYGSTIETGVYEAQIGTNNVRFAVNLLDENESRIQPKESISTGKYTEIQASASIPSNREFWRWIALAGLFVLMFEWWFYHKRTA